MPATSVRQRRYFGAIAGGAIPKPQGMTDKTVHDFASTKEKGLPAKATHLADGGTPGHWMERAFAHNKGGLHRALHVPEGKTIPKAKVAKAAEAGGHLGKMAQAAENAGGVRKRKNFGS